MSDLSNDEALCGSEPPREITAPDGRVLTGDCWCTLDSGHEGLCFCGPCTERLDAPGWEKK